MNDSEKAMVFIDGSNFYHKLKELTSHFQGKYSLSDYKFHDFCVWLVRPHKFVQARYYVGAIRRQVGNNKAEEMYASQQKFIAKLDKQNIPVKLGQLIRHPDGSIHEKGVDIRLAVEMIRYARKEEYDIAYLITSDTDFVPAVEEVQHFGKRVHYVGISKGQSFGLTKASNETILLRSDDVKPFSYSIT